MVDVGKKKHKVPAFAPSVGVTMSILFNSSAVPEKAVAIVPVLRAFTYVLVDVPNALTNVGVTAVVALIDAPPEVADSSKVFAVGFLTKYTV